MESLTEEYRRSLKLSEAEELLDLIVYRPIAALFVRLVRRSRITPNQVTILSLGFALAAAWNIGAGAEGSLAAAGIWYFISNILDCADGQLARLQNSGTPLGRLIDGIADYISGIAILAAIGIRYAAAGDGVWTLVVLTGFSTAVHSLLFDHYQGEYIRIVRGTGHRVDAEITVESASAVKASNGKRMTLGLYSIYRSVQERLKPSAPTIGGPDLYRRAHRRSVRLWSFLGPTTNRSLLIVCLFAGAPVWYLWGVVVAGNFLLPAAIVYQRMTAVRPDMPAGEGSLR